MWERLAKLRLERHVDAGLDDQLRSLAAHGRFNRGTLLPGGDLSNACTASFNLLGHESLIMRQSDIGTISDSIKD